MRSGLAVDGPGGPAVVLNEDIPSAEGDHRLDSEGHSGLEDDTVASSSVVAHLGILVHLPTYTMAHELANNAVSGFLAVGLDGSTDISETSISAVGMPAVELDRRIHRDDVAFLENDLVGGDAVNHLFVNRRTEGCGIILVSKARGTATMIHDELVRYLIQLGGSNTRLDSLSHFGISLTKQDVACPHEFYFFVSLEKNHLSNELVGHSTGATFDAHAGLEESVIVAHQEMTLDLLQSIQNNTYHDQQGRTAEELREAHRDTKQASERRQDSDEGEQDRTRQGDAAHGFTPGMNPLFSFRFSAI